MGPCISDKYECGIVQTMSHIVNECPVTELFDGGLQRLHFSNADAVNCLELTAMKAVMKWNEIKILFTPDIIMTS